MTSSDAIDDNGATRRTDKASEKYDAKQFDERGGIGYVFNSDFA